MASGTLTRHRSVSNRQEAPQLVLPKGKDADSEPPFEPCAATASHFLFAQGSTVLVLGYHTLALERKFTSHTDNLQFIQVDNVSERGAGKLVVTYDIGKTAIIWDLFTGEQLSRFASFEPLLVAAWMRNGNIAFGNEKGDVILFEPSTSEHVSSRTIFDPITALAPSFDCKTYAIGYRNGSILLAALQPNFTILHTLTTSRSPSPIAMLTWHASSSKQKSDMLAIQKSDGDLRVWSVSKPPISGAPRAIRTLKRHDNFVQGQNWVSWSRNGRIIQFSEGATWAWDVRTKDVSYVTVPTIEYVKGIAAHGPSASLFTLGPDYTIQQYDVDTGQMIANIRHTPITIPPTPPEDHIRQFNTVNDDELNSPLKPSRYDPESSRHRADTPASAHSHTLSETSRKSEKKPAVNEMISPAKTERTATTFSLGTYSYNYSQAQGQQPQPISPASGKLSNGLSNGLRKGSRLRQEVIMSPMTPADDTLTTDLFPFARARLSEIPQQSAKPLNETTMSPDDLRKHMLNTVFGWENDIYALIQDELSRHPPESLNALFLAKWLDYDSEMIAEIMGTAPADPAMDWVRLALAVLDSRPESKKLGQIFIEKMLLKGEIHMAAVTLLALGDKNDAIEVYVSNSCYLEAILLTCLLMPQDWQRQSHLVRRWGEHVVENSQQHLAIRCFACTGVEPSDAWISPTAQMFSRLASPMSAVLQQPPQQLPAQAAQRPLQQHYQPPAVNVAPAPTNPLVSRLKGRGFEAPTPVALDAPPTPFRTAAARGTRITPQTGGLKLITTFGQKANQFKFPGLKTDDMTPTNAASVTPIAESAIDRSALSPGGLGSYRLNNIASLNNAMSAGGLAPRQRLPSIGETPLDVESPSFGPRSNARAPPTPADSGSDKEREKLTSARYSNTQQEQRRDRQEPQLTLLTPARYNPRSTPVRQIESDEPQTALRPTTSASWQSQLRGDSSITLNGSRNKKPEGLSLMLAQDPIEQRPGTTDTDTTNFSMMSPEDTIDNWRVKSPSVGGKSVDQYISSLEQAQYYGKARSRNSSRAPREEKTARPHSRHRKSRPSEDARSRPEVPSGKRSPSSPIPMSPEDVKLYSGHVDSFAAVCDSATMSTSDAPTTSSRDRRHDSASTAAPGRARRRSRSVHRDRRRPSNVRGRGTSPALDPEASRRGRSQTRKEGSGSCSPSSPMPTLPSDSDAQDTSNVDTAFKFVSQNRSRLNRSTSRRPRGETSTRRETSSERRRERAGGSTRRPENDSSTQLSRKSSVSTKAGRRREPDANETVQSEGLGLGSLDQLDALAASLRGDSVSNPRLPRTKELAQAELEARRLSLARRPSAPAIPMPGQFSQHSKSASDGLAAPPLTRNHTDSVLRTLPRASYESTGHFSRGRPSTPQAMQAPMEEQTQRQDRYETLSNSTYLLPARTFSPSITQEDPERSAPSEIPETMPRHPAFDQRVNQSRGNSRSRTRTSSPGGHRGKSMERRRITEEEEEEEEEEAPPLIFDTGSPNAEAMYRLSTGPVFIPELQHLAAPPPPPPPPPPPAPPKDLRIYTEFPTATAMPLPKSAYIGEPNSATPEKGHRRTSSRGEGQFLGKFRGITKGMRSSSKPRDNYTRSPNPDEGIMSPYETVTMVPPALTAITERR